MVAQQLSKEFHVPWVAEFRDLWSDNHNYAYPRWRCLIDETMERRTMKSAAAIVTVSKPLAQALNKKYQVPTVVAMNGYDPEDFLNGMDQQDIAPELRLVYTGNIYSEQYDVDLLLDGIKRFCEIGGKVVVDFMGRNLGDAKAKAADLGLERICNFLPPIPHKEAIARQCNADILLFFCWQGSAQAGVYTSKLFEYMGARRPILAVGDPLTEAAGMIKERGAGTITDNAAMIVRVLSSWAEIKRQRGSLPRLPDTVARGLTREEQFRPIQKLLMELKRN